MIKECNFKFRYIQLERDGCQLGSYCAGEDNCILYQTYKTLCDRKNVLDSIMDGFK